MWEVGLLFVLGAGAPYWFQMRSQRLYLREWRAAVESLGLRVEEISGSWSGPLWLRAREGPIEVQICPSPTRRGQGPQIMVEAPWPQGFFDVRIRPEGDKPAGAREIEIGDEPFDQAFYLVGPAPLLFALLDAETRRLMLAFPESSLRIGGNLWAEVTDLSLTETLRLVLDLARRLTRPLEAAQRVADNARLDASSEVRMRNLLALVRELPGEAVTTEALRAACADPSPKVRLRAAKVLGNETRGLLLELAASTEDDTASAQALAILGSGLPVERTREILVQAMRRRLPRTARACLETLGRSGAAEDVDILAKVLAREKSDLAEAAAQALGETGHPIAEPPLLAALRHQRPDVCVAAAKALARAGSAAAVLPLKEAAEQTRDPALRSATRQTIAEIQSRLQGASPGQLSLADGEVGYLSLAEAEAGQLSLPEEQDGRLSLSPAEKTDGASVPSRKL